MNPLYYIINFVFYLLMNIVLRYGILLYARVLHILNCIFIFQLTHCPDITFIPYVYITYLYNTFMIYAQPQLNDDLPDDISHDNKILHANIVTPYNCTGIYYSFRTYLIMNKQNKFTLFSVNKFLLLYNEIISSSNDILVISYAVNEDIKYKSILLSNFVCTIIDI